MNIVRFQKGTEVSYGILEENRILALAHAPYAGITQTGAAYEIADVQLLVPCEPSKIVCVGLNYRDHAAEMGEALPEAPLLFLKPPSALLPSGGTIQHPPESQRVDYEAELAIVIGKRARQLTPEQAGSHIFGYTCANDVTARDLQKLDGQWTRGKGFDTFLPLGPAIRTDLDHADLSISLSLNGEVRQQSRTSNLIFDIPQLVSAISQVMTLLPGDVILTGTPSGIGPMAPGDRVSIRIEGLLPLGNQMQKAERT